MKHTIIYENPLCRGRYGVCSIPYADMGHFDGTRKECEKFAPVLEEASSERFQKDVRHAIENGMREEEMNRILAEKYARGEYIPQINKKVVIWEKKYH